MCAGCQAARGAAERSRIEEPHADCTDSSMKQEMMAEGPRCKRRKQANPRRKNGKSTTHHTVPARPAGGPGWELPARPLLGPRQTDSEKFLTGLYGGFTGAECLEVHV